jgi:TIR domain-containing protein
VRVFLSHRTESEGPLARTLSGDLARRGIRTWTAADADPASTWSQAVEAGLRACTHAVVLVAAGTMDSREVRHELQVAELLELDGRLVLIPAMLDRVELPSWLPAAAAVDLTGDYEDGLDALTTALRRTSPRGKPRTAGTTAPADRLIVHRVRRGDRIDLLAAQYLGEPSHWRLIAEENPGVDVTALEPGSLVSIRARGR